MAQGCDLIMYIPVACEDLYEFVDRGLVGSEGGGRLMFEENRKAVERVVRIANGVEESRQGLIRRLEGDGGR